MALEIRVYREITDAEPKVMWGMGWRQIAASAAMLALGGAMWFVFRRWLGLPEAGQWAVFAACLPPAVWGWWRPKGLKPEVWLRYVLRQRFGQRVYGRAPDPARPGRGDGGAR